MSSPDAVVVGSGPNGLAAALTLARAGLSVEVLEGSDSPGGGCRTEQMSLAGFHHDVCASVHPLLAASPFFRGVDLAARGAVLRTPAIAFAHPLDGGRAATVATSLEATAARLGVDAAPYEALFGPLVRDATAIVGAALTPLRSIPARPSAVARFGALGMASVEHLARRFATEDARALVAGAAAHSMLPLDAPLSGAYGLLLTVLAHAVGWPVVEGGSARIVDALVAEFESLGGRVATGKWVRSLDELPPSRAVLLDVTPGQFVDLAGDRLPPRARSWLARFRHGPGVCKVDWALSEPVPWTSAHCRQAVTLHVGGSFEQIAESEAEVAALRHADRPYCIVVQPAVIDPTRAPPGRHTLWGYCHVPNGSPVDMTGRIEAQIERFAPGFRDVVLARSTTTAARMADANPNYVGGDINGGAGTLLQTVFRPTPRWNPYRTALEATYLCSASTAPGGGVHGMCGHGAALAALADLGVAPAPPGTR